MAASIWSRYGTKLFKELASSPTVLETVLSGLPDTVCLADLRSWIVQALLPNILRSSNARQLVPVLALWIERRAVDLEV